MPSTSPDSFPYPESGAAADVPADVKALAEKIQSKYGAISLSKLTVPGGEGDDGKIAIVENGVLKLKAVSGDATITELGDLELGAEVVDTATLADKGVTTAKLDDLAVSRAKLAAAVMQTKRSETLSITAASNTEVALTWATEFPNTNYTVALSIRRSSGFSFVSAVDAYVIGKSKTGITVLVNNGSGSTITPVIEATAIGD